MGILLIILLNPVLTYGNSTKHNGFVMLHNEPLDPSLIDRLDSATALLKASEFYNPELVLEICLNDGSNYPAIIQKLRGDAFAWGFYDKVVLQGSTHAEGNYVELNGYKWNLTELLAHEAVHCLQFDRLGFWNSNPIAKVPEWKWEGYPEYISRKTKDHRNLTSNIERLLAAQSSDENGWAVTFPDSTIAPRAYYGYCLMVQYCLDIKKMSYAELLQDSKGEEEVKEEMLQWYSKQKQFHNNN